MSEDAHVLQLAWMRPIPNISEVEEFCMDRCRPSGACIAGGSPRSPRMVSRSSDRDFSAGRPPLRETKDQPSARGVRTACQEDEK